jgi:hypothetical protein
MPEPQAAYTPPLPRNAGYWVLTHDGDAFMRCATLAAAREEAHAQVTDTTPVVIALEVERVEQRSVTTPLAPPAEGA